MGKKPDFNGSKTHSHFLGPHSEASHLTTLVVTLVGRGLREYGVLGRPSGHKGWVRFFRGQNLQRKTSNKQLQVAARASQKATGKQRREDEPVGQQGVKATHACAPTRTSCGHTQCPRSRSGHPPAPTWACPAGLHSLPETFHCTSSYLPTNPHL